VAFGLEVRKLPAAKIDAQVAAALQQVQLAGLGPERVDRLSGGQQQRVALARALVIRPELLLLDEPLSNLDAKLREETRATLRALHAATGVTTIYVTHDQAEAMGMSDRIAILNRGRIEQLAAPADIYERPATRFVADFIGRNNVLDAVVRSVSGQSFVVRFADGTELTVNSARRAAGVELLPGARIGVCIRAESLRPADETGPIHGVVSDVEYAGSGSYCEVQTAIGRLRVDVPSSAGRPVKGEPIHLAIHDADVHIVPAEGPQ
jgi:iron(III) transport system ATP-binding protein